MLTQEIAEFEGQFAIVVKDGVVTEIGKSFILQPEIKFAEPSIQ